jgi:hypothetical protein
MEMERGFVYTAVDVGRSIGHVFLAVGVPESPLPMIQDQSLKYRSRPVGSWTDEETSLSQRLLLLPPMLLTAADVDSSSVFGFFAWWLDEASCLKHCPALAWERGRWRTGGSVAVEVVD